MDALNVKSALDLREEPNLCKKAAEHNVVTGMAVAPIQVCSYGATVCQAPTKRP